MSLLSPPNTVETIFAIQMFNLDGEKGADNGFPCETADFKQDCQGLDQV